MTPSKGVRDLGFLGFLGVFFQSYLPLASNILQVLEGYRDEVGPIVEGRPVNVKVNLLINDMMPIEQVGGLFL